MKATLDLYIILCKSTVVSDCLFVIADLLKEIDVLAEDYLNNVRTMSGDKRKEHLDKIQKMFSKSKEFGDDKVQLAMQTYEMVCYFVRSN